MFLQRTGLFTIGFLLFTSIFIGAFAQNNINAPVDSIHEKATINQLKQSQIKKDGTKAEPSERLRLLRCSSL